VCPITASILQRKISTVSNLAMDLELKLPHPLPPKPLRVTACIWNDAIRSFDPSLPPDLKAWQFEELPGRQTEHIIARFITTKCFSADTTVPAFRIGRRERNYREPDAWALTLTIDYGVEETNSDPNVLVINTLKNVDAPAVTRLSIESYIPDKLYRKDINDYENEIKEMLKDSSYQAYWEPRPQQTPPV
jgi:hypothetical protein